MNIVAASDLHVSSLTIARAAAIAQAMVASEAEILVLAGDLTSGPTERYRKVLSLFADFSGPKLFVPGNHDVWVDDPNPQTWRRYETELAEAVEDSGFHYLDRAPLIVDDVAFIGCLGWYDYSLRQLGPPSETVRLTPMRPARGPDGHPELLEASARADLTWDELTEQDYALKGLVWTDADKRKSMIWNDAVYADWRRSDAEMVQFFVQRLQTQADEAAGKARATVAVTHCVPFPEAFARDTEDVSWAYTRAYLGSTRIGDVLRSIPNLRLSIFGHSHVARVFAVDDFAAANVSVADRESGPVLLEV